MKQLMKLLVLGWVYTHSVHIMAAPEYMSLGGPPSLPGDTRCSLSASSPVIDYGTQSRWQLQDATANQGVTPGKRTLTVNITCPFSQTMRLALRGERSQDGELRYGDKGSISARVLDGQLDGHNVSLVTTTPSGIINGSPVSALHLQPDGSFAAAKNGQLAKGKSFSLRMQLEPVMPESAARVASRQVSESNLTLELIGD